jgi:hypothetical protein
MDEDEGALEGLKHCHGGAEGTRGDDERRHYFNT